MKISNGCLATFIILTIIGLLIYISTAKSDSCRFYQAEVSLWKMSTNELIDSKTFNGCFEKNLIDASLSQFEISSSISPFKVIFYEESDPNILKFLDIHSGDNEPSRWRANEGHELFMLTKNDTLNFIFGDKKSGVKGSIKFIP